MLFILFKSNGFYDTTPHTFSTASNDCKVSSIKLKFVFITLLTAREGHQKGGAENLIKNSQTFSSSPSDIGDNSFLSLLEVTNFYFALITQFSHCKHVARELPRGVHTPSNSKVNQKRNVKFITDKTIKSTPKTIRDVERMLFNSNLIPESKQTHFRELS